MVTKAIRAVKAAPLSRWIWFSQKACNSVSQREQRRMHCIRAKCTTHADDFDEVEEDNNRHEGHTEVKLTFLRFWFAQAVLHVKQGVIIEVIGVRRANLPFFCALRDFAHVA